MRVRHADADEINLVINVYALSRRTSVDHENLHVSLLFCAFSPQGAKGMTGRRDRRVKYFIFPPAFLLLPKIVNAALRMTRWQKKTCLGKTASLRVLL